MKKFMKYFSKSLAILLSVLTIISVMPMQTFAEELTNSITDEYVAENTEYNISEEVVEERTEYKKVYQLIDGTFYEITSNTPIHENENGNWVEPEIQTDIPTTTSEAVERCDELSEAITSNNSGISTFGFDVNETVTSGSSSVTYRILGNTASTSTQYLKSSTCLVAQFPNSDIKKLNNTQTTINCKIFLNCKSLLTSEIYAYNVSSEIDLSKSDLIKSDISISNTILDFASVRATSDYAFDITDSYIKWEKGLENNFGIVFTTTSAFNTTIYGCYITRQYRIFDSYDTDYSYHTVDMGRAGTVYINDYTNTVLIKRNELGIDGNIMPVELVRLLNYGYSDKSYNASGTNAWWNYQSYITEVTSYNCKWQTTDGNSICFIPDTNKNTDSNYKYWIDGDGIGYSLEIDTTQTNKFNQAKITTPDEMIYTFGNNGKLIEISDKYANKITVHYKTDDVTQTNIYYVQDGLERRYYFNYDDKTFTLPDGSEREYEVLKSITVKTQNSDSSWEEVKIDDAVITISYDYVYLKDDMIALSRVDYPDNEFVTYTYNEDGYLTEITDIDERRLTLNYSIGETIITQDENGNTNETIITKNLYPCLTSYVEEVVNIDDDSQSEDYQKYLLKSSLSIDNHNSYQRIFTNHMNETETIQYNNNLKILYYNSKENTFYADYSKNPNGEEYLSQILSPEEGVNLFLDSDFETGVDNWSIGTNQLSEKTITGNGIYAMKLTGQPNAISTASQIITGDNIEGGFNEGDIFVIGGWSEANTPIPTNSHFWGFEVYIYQEDDEGNLNDVLLYSLAYDSTIDDEAQYRLGAFELPSNIEFMEVRLVYSFQNGSAYFDEVQLYKSDLENVSLFDGSLEEVETTNAEETDGSNADTTSETITNTMGLPVTEITSDGSSTMLEQYAYDNNYYLSSNTNSNNINTNYSYNSKNGILESMTIGNMKTNYSYTATGALSEVSKVNAALTTDSNKLTTEYSYSHDRITSVIHNGFQYTFTYNSFGNVKKVDIENISSLLSYDYSKDYKQNLNSITYANGNILSYEYDENDNVKAIYFQNGSTQDRKCYYQYEYDENGNLVKITDNDSARVVEYSDNLYTISEIITDEDGNTQLNTIFSETVNSGVENAESSVSGTLFGVDFTYTEYEREYQSSGNNTKYSSKYTFTIDNSPINMESVSVSDYFGRVASTEFSVSPFYASSNTNTHTIYNTYTYKEYDTSYEKDGETINVSPATTSLIETFETQVINKYVETDEAGNSITRNEKVSNIFTTSYKYDAAGRITHIIYSQGDANSVLASYYEYDEFGQLILEIDGLSRTLKKFTYDLAGNITKKEIYDKNAFSVDNSFNVTIDTTAEHKTINLEYNVPSDSSQISFPDLLTSFDGHPISYDKNGNPLNYYTGTSNDEEYALTWEGTLLKSVRNEDMKIDYSYDSTGLRTKKTFYSLDNNGNQTLSQEIEYIWSDDVLVGYEIVIYEDGVPSRVVVKVLYDEYGSPIGVGYHVVNTDIITDESATTVLSNDNILWFIKDGQGNVQAIYSELDDFALNCSYDSYGNLDVGLSGRFIDEINSVISAASSSNEKLMYAIAYAIACAVTTGITLEIGQNSYKGYLLDVETGLYYCQNRYYSPEWCRFISMDDPAQLTQNYEHPLNANLYAYCYNDPVNNIDPTGRSSYTLTGVGLQAEMSASFLSFAGEVGIELIYVWSKNALYTYYYYGGGNGYGYTNKAINYLKSSFKDMAISPKVSLKNIANLFRLNYSISIGFFGAFTDKSFSWPNSYASGYSHSNAISIGKFKGYYAKSSGCKVYGICYAPIGNSGFSLSSTAVKYKKINFSASKIKTYLSSQKNNIAKAVG